MRDMEQPFLPFQYCPLLPRAPQALPHLHALCLLGPLPETNFKSSLMPSSTYPTKSRIPKNGLFYGNHPRLPIPPRIIGSDSHCGSLVTAPEGRELRKEVKELTQGRTDTCPEVRCLLCTPKAAWNPSSMVPSMQQYICLFTHLPLFLTRL